jgi:hypothetical protein
VARDPGLELVRLATEGDQVLGEGVVAEHRRVDLGLEGGCREHLFY